MACFSVWDIINCGCTTSCSQAFTVTGCGGIAYPGLTVSVYTSSGGTLLASGTTNGSGQVALSWSGSSGTYWVAITGQSARFAAYGQSLALTCGGSKVIALATASGYHCDCSASGCLLPVADTLFLTDGVYGAVTLAYGSRTFTLIGGTPQTLTGWWGTIGVPYVGACFVCAGGTATLDYFYSCGLVNLYSNICSAGASGSCLWFPGAGVFAGYQEVASTALQARTWSCPPSFGLASTAIQINSCLTYCNGASITSGSASITVTE